MRRENTIPERQLEWLPPKRSRSSWEWRYAAWFNFSVDKVDVPADLAIDPFENKPIISLVGLVVSKEKGGFFRKDPTPRAHLLVVSPVIYDGKKALFIHANQGERPLLEMKKEGFTRTDLDFHVQFFPGDPVSSGCIRYFSDTPLLECKTKDTAQPAMAGYLEDFLLKRDTWCWQSGRKLISREFLHSSWSLWETEEKKVYPAAEKLIPSQAKNFHGAFVVKGSAVFCR